MAVTQYVWTVEEVAGVVIADDVAVSPFDRVFALGANAHLGNGLLRPFRRNQKNDFANADGEKLVRSAVGQVLGTRGSNERIVGELPWNTEFGSLIEILRHMPNDDTLQELGRLFVVEAIQRWEPRVVISRVDISRKKSDLNSGENVLEIALVYDIIQATVAGNNVILPDVEQVLQIAA